jgi:DNA-binding CsgD family transcriptional regulator
LLEYLARRATDAGCRVLTVAAIQSEMELAFATLHQLCWPLRDHLTSIPVPQQDALSTAFGLTGGAAAPDRFLVGLAVLSLLADAATDRPLVCVVDDEQWLDRASARALAFVAHRLVAESVGLVFGGREVSAELEALPEMAVGGLAPEDARALLATVLEAPLAAAVVDQIIAETGGNPLALLELPKVLTPGELATGFLVPGARLLCARVEEGFRRRADDLPRDARRLVLVAAAEPLGDPALLWRAAARLGISAPAAPPVEEAGLIVFGDRISFRHPLVRSAVYQSASAQERREVHAALTEATDAGVDPDRRAWHRALAALGPDEEIAQDLERSAVRAQARGGLAAAAALLERSASLTVDPERRALRSIAAAGAHIDAGALGPSAALVAAAEAGPLDQLGRVTVELVRARSAMAWGEAGDAVRRYVHAAKRLESIDARRARDIYLYALAAASSANSQAPEASLDETARAARAAPSPPGSPRPHDLLLDGLALVTTDGWASAAPALRKAIAALADAELRADEGIFWFGISTAAATLLWDWENYQLFATRGIQATRELGVIRLLPRALDTLASSNVLAGDFAAAASLIGEAEAIVEATRSTVSMYSPASLAGWRGHRAGAEAIIGATMEHGRARGQGSAVKVAQAAGATLYNGLARYDEALAFARQANDPPAYWSSHLNLHELVEAAARSGEAHMAAEALERLSESTQASGTDWALGVETRSRALLSTGDAAEALYHEAIERLDRSPLRPEAARAHLLYGEWLRREKRRVEGREQLRTAHGLFDTMGARAFADRARIELSATGERARSRRLGPTADLTPQERQIAHMAASGATNQEIASQLFLSANTIDYHLRKVFQKLQITRRGQLHEAFATAPP